MKSVCLLICFMFLVSGCSNNVNTKNDDKSNSLNEDGVVVTKEIDCSVDGSNFVLVLENGQIVKYIDEVDGELGQETVDILNSEHLIGIDDNDEALVIMDSALKDLGGFCK